MAYLETQKGRNYSASFGAPGRIARALRSQARRSVRTILFVFSEVRIGRENRWDIAVEGASFDATPFFARKDGSRFALASSRLRRSVRTDC